MGSGSTTVASRWSSSPTAHGAAYDWRAGRTEVPLADHPRTPLDGSQAKCEGEMRLARWSAAVVVILGAGLAGAFTGWSEQVCLLDSANYCYATHDWASTPDSGRSGDWRRRRSHSRDQLGVHGASHSATTTSRRVMPSAGWVEVVSRALAGPGRDGSARRATGRQRAPVRWRCGRRPRSPRWVWPGTG